MYESMAEVAVQQDRLERVARALLEARRARGTVDAAPLSALLRGDEDAYAVQERVARELGWFDGRPPRYWKSGGPSRAATLTHAALPPPNVWPSPTQAADVHFNIRLIEIEIALRLAVDVDARAAARLTPEAAAGLVDAMTVSIEVVDSRWVQETAAPPLLKLADLQSHGALVLGEWQPFRPRDWQAQSCEVHIGTAAVRRFEGTHSLGDPAWLLPTWLAHVTRRHGIAPAGTVVTTGTWCGMLPAAAGDEVRARFDGIGEAVVQL